VPTNFAYDQGTDTLTLEFSGLPEDEYSLTLFSGNGAFEDVVGNDLDGEPVWPLPSGDGVAGGDFFVNFSADVTTSPFPVPLVAIQPTGSLVYEGTEMRVIGNTGDTDSFTLDIDADQTVTIILDPEATLHGSVALYDPSLTLMASISAGAVGEDAVIQTIPVGLAGTYTITVSGVGGTTGTYDLQAVLNAAAEGEAHDGPANDVLASAEDIEGSFIALDGGAERGAVVGELATGGDEDWHSFVLAAGDVITLAVTSLDGGSASVQLYGPGGGVLAAGVPADNNVNEAITDFTAAAAGAYYARAAGEGAYGLVIVRDGTFDFQAEDTQDITTTGT
ncbi:MAG: pre-peptidase C-terminal domain-containing protein, partial [Phycisphaerae bacterium]|nr:pre-peptidase C-terminal domain-containing protein [Phycisphaerae bacterium]